MKGSGGKSPQSMEVGLNHEGKDDLGDRRVFMGTNPPVTSGHGVGLVHEDARWKGSPGVGNDYEERRAAPGTNSPSTRGLGMGLGRQNISGIGLRTPMERNNSGVTGDSGLPRTKPSLPARRGLQNECLLAGCLPGRKMPSPLGIECGSPQTVGSRRGAETSTPERTEASVRKQPALGVEPRRELEKEVTCVVTKPSSEVKPPVEVDIGLPQSEEADETKEAEPQIGLVIEPPVCQFEEKKEEAENFEPGVEFPDHIRPIYAGKFFDRTPCWPSAGKVIPVGYRVASCLTEKLPRLITPPEAKKFFNFRYPPAGAERVFYGRANDPPIAPYLTHGIRSKISSSASTLINPQPMTTFQQKLKDKKESLYFSHRRAPLGKSHDQMPGLPKGLDIINTTFGTAITREFSAGDVVNPPKSYSEVFKEGNEGHELYIVSHNDYYAGEAKNRKYDPSSFHKFNLYGVPTPHFNDGRNMAKTLYWLHELQMKRGAKVVSKRVDDFKEKFQHKLGRVLDPIAETMNVPPDHTFGACLRPEEYGAGDLIHNRLPGEFLRGKDRQRALIAAVRHHLKKVNYQHFDSLLAAFRHYDKKGDGMIDQAELREACDQVNLHLDEKLLDQLFDYCDVDEDGLINYLEFANFLNWKDQMPLKEYEERVIIKGYPIYGVPTIRSDIPAPRIRRISDRTNYGEEGNAYSLLHPTIFSQKGVFERDFFKTRSKEEIAQLLCNIGVQLSDEEFENVWDLASRKHHSGEVCVENIRNVLDELQHADRIKCKTPV
ncbi:EF-hand domain-containing family member B isoform X2 [Dasypus novemcinctus]|uniref:EF-hand domain-containing family member B isoform X2 n=1 Tax=Dasypus novemcinctus TaxID=9361 RepID=UPI00265FECC6|nr:EF-hand domain-containing family member B isoform X1 [Dasypus novemcinctus]